MVTDPNSVAIGDFNGDGMQDFAAVNYAGSNVSVRLGDGSGGFTSPATPEVTVDVGPNLVAIADLNGDGIQDLATANLFSNDVSIRLGDGSVGFAPPALPATPEVAVGVRPTTVAIGDFNNDGIQDFATANIQSNNVSIRLGSCTTATPSIVINEVDYDQPNVDTADFVELYNISPNRVDLTGYTLELVNGSGGGAAIYDTIDLPSVMLASGDYFVVWRQRGNGT